MHAAASLRAGSVFPPLSLAALGAGFNHAVPGLGGGLQWPDSSCISLPETRQPPCEEAELELLNEERQQETEA